MSDFKYQADLANVEGNKEYKNRNFVDALKFYESAIELDPKNMKYISNKAAVYFELNQNINCIKECEKAIEVGTENKAEFFDVAKIFSRMARVYAKQDDFVKAKVFYQKSLINHRTTDTLTNLSDIEKLQKEKERKLFYNTETADEERKLGNILFQQGDYTGSIVHYNKAIKCNSEDAKLYNNRAACYQMLFDYNMALKDCEICIKLDKNYLKGYIRKGKVLFALKDTINAQFAFKKAIEISESNKEALEGYKMCELLLSSSPEDLRKRALADPEVYKILIDPSMSHILEQIKNDPKALQEHLGNPLIKSKIFKLITSGFLIYR